MGALPKYSRPYVDYDYVDSLSDKDKEWLNEFTEEYYGNTFRKDKKKKLKSGKKKKLKRGLHAKAGLERTELYRQTNERNRDIYNQRLRADIADTSESETDSPEDAIINRMDKANSGYFDWLHDDFPGDIRDK